jgi:predicted phage baseplate assembly protein
MPLANHFPRVDDRTEQDILNEALARIPRYTPEWTDYNPGDPGVALLELFAWMSEMLIYRLGKVPELNYLKFLELVGIELAPARPATTMLTFPVTAGFTGAFVTVPARTQIASAAPDEAGPILFETERVLTALKSKLDAVQSHDGYAYSDVSAANEALDGFLPFGQNANVGTSLLLGFSGDAELPPSVELSLAFWPAVDRKVPPAAPCGGGTVAAVAPARFAWEFWAGTEWRPLTLLADETLAFTRSGLVRLRTPPPGQAVKAGIGQAPKPTRWWIRARLEQASYETAPKLRGVRANAVRAEQAQSIALEVLGGSEGTPNQIFGLGSTPVLDGSLTVTVDETGTATPWQEVSDFLGSGPRDPHFMLNRSTGEVRFGDGRQGRIPAANPDSPQANIVAAAYRTGGGARGNLPAALVTTLMGSVAGLDSGKITNPVAAEGGTDEESLAAAVARAPVALKARDRAVTAEDYEMLAIQAGPIKRAKALPLYHPHYPGIDVPGTVTVLIVPDAPGDAPTPSEALMQTVCAHLDARRLLTTELFVTAPPYVGVDLRLDVIAEADADAGAVTIAVEEAVRAYLHPLTGGRDGAGWAFGEPIRYGELYRHALIDGVERIPELVIALDTIEKPPCQDVAIPVGALIRVDSVTVAVRSSEEEASA